MRLRVGCGRSLDGRTRLIPDPWPKDEYQNLQHGYRYRSMWLRQTGVANLVEVKFAKVLAGTMRLQKIFTASLIGLIPAASIAQSCGNSSAIGKVWTHKQAVLFKTPALNIDADGAPNSYLLDGNGLSFICDGVVAIKNGKRITRKSNPNDWQQECQTAWLHAKATGDYSGIAIFGFLKDRKNVPLIQSEGDPEIAP